MRYHMHSYAIRILETCIAQVTFECPFQFVIFHVLLEVHTNSFVTNWTLFRLPTLGNFLPNMDFRVPFEWVLTFEYFTANLARICLQCQFSFREMSQPVFATGWRFRERFATHIALVGLVTFVFIFFMEWSKTWTRKIYWRCPYRCVFSCVLECSVWLQNFANKSRK